MAKSSKMSDFRTLNLDEKETTPTKKNVGAVSAKKNKKILSKPKNKPLREIYEEEVEDKKPQIGVAVFFLILIIAGAIVGIMFTPAFNIVYISIDEGTNVSASEVMAKFDGIEGQNIFRVNIKALEKAVKEIPYVRSVDILRDFPGTLNVVVEEREPYAIIKYMESYVVVDKFGYVLEIKKENDMPELAIIYGIDADEYIIGKKIEDVAGLKYENITYLLETAFKNNFEYTIYEINYFDTEKLVMAVKDLDVDINFGEVDRNVLTEKMSYLNGILKKLNGKKGNLDISSNNYLEKTIFTERF